VSYTGSCDIFEVCHFDRDIKLGKNWFITRKQSFISNTNTHTFLKKKSRKSSHESVSFTITNHIACIKIYKDLNLIDPGSFLRTWTQQTKKGYLLVWNWFFTPQWYFMPNKYNCMSTPSCDHITASVVQSGFEPWLGQTKDYKISIFCFSAKHAALRTKNKDCLAQNKNNMSDCSNMFILVLV
jgi:hypothetical protein